MSKEKIIAIVAGALALLLIATGLFFILKPAKVPTAQIGEEISIPLELKTNPGIAAGDITVEYDTDNLVFVSAKGNEKFEVDSTVQDNGKVRCILVFSGAAENSKMTGELLNLKFRVKDTAEPGEYTLKVGNDSKFANIDEKWVECKFKESKFEIKEKTKK